MEYSFSRGGGRGPTSPQYSLIKSFFSAPSLRKMPHPATSEGARRRCLWIARWMATFRQLHIRDSRSSPAERVDEGGGTKILLISQYPWSAKWALNGVHKHIQTCLVLTLPSSIVEETDLPHRGCRGPGHTLSRPGNKDSASYCMILSCTDTLGT